MSLGRAAMLLSMRTGRKAVPVRSCDITRSPVAPQSTILPDNKRRRGRTPMPHRWTLLTAFSALVALSISVPATAQTPAWAPADLLAAAKAEGGTMTVYGSMNEQEALPYYKLFEDATGIKVTYVRASDTALFSRIT